MFVLYNSNLNRYFKHPKVGGVWWTADQTEAQLFLDKIKQIAVGYGYPELVDGFSIQEIPEMIEEINENQASPGI
jgi:hypothetical protein